MYISELSDYTLSPTGVGNGLAQCYFAISAGDVCSIHSDSTDDAHLLFKALTTLIIPSAGTYRFMGKSLNFQDYRSLLPIKRKIGYIAIDSALINNRTIRENLLLMRNFFDNSLTIDLDERTYQLCRQFNISHILDTRVADVDLLSLRIAVVIRELTKPLELLLIERPEDFIGHTYFNIFIEIIKDLILSEIPVVFLSYDQAIVDEFSNKHIQINEGKVTTIHKQK
jgi:ABC-type sugar transport system ATPase subunit